MKQTYKYIGKLGRPVIKLKTLTMPAGMLNKYDCVVFTSLGLLHLSNRPVCETARISNMQSYVNGLP